MELVQYFIFGFLFALAIARPIIFFLKKLKYKQAFRDLGPQSHIETKAGTPTMGAWIFLIPVFFVLVFVSIKSSSLEEMLIASSFFIGSVLGAYDDLLKIVKKNSAGLSSKGKLIIQLLMSTSIVYILGKNSHHFEGWPVMVEYIWAFLVIAGSSNAVNLTDGLDGLAAGVSAASFGALGILLFLTGNIYSAYICFAVVGGLLAFLLFNKNPAQVFMGDTGSLALGMGLGTIAYVNHLEWYLLIFALIPVLESISVMVQVFCAKFSRKFIGKDIRPFKMAPLHHHFELSGMEETQVVRLFCFLQFILAFGFLLYLKLFCI